MAKTFPEDEQRARDEMFARKMEEEPSITLRLTRSQTEHLFALLQADVHRASAPDYPQDARRYAAWEFYFITQQAPECVPVTKNTLRGCTPRKPTAFRRGRNWPFGERDFGANHATRIL